MTFDEWLAEQRNRQDPVGGLAREVEWMPNWPTSGTESDRYFFLIEIGTTTDEQLALARAHREYRDRTRRH
jgi:hypothetical protein